MDPLQWVLPVAALPEYHEVEQFEQLRWIKLALMDPKCVALISGQSLLVEGVASRLKTEPSKVMSKVFSPVQDDIDDQLVDLQPDVVIVDSRDPDVRRSCALYDLVQLLPNAKFLVLDSEKSELQIVTSQRQPIANAQALLEQVLLAI